MGAAMQRLRGTGVASSVVAFGLVAVSVVMTSGSAVAADLPAVKAPVLKAPAALWSWSGLYIGGHVGAALSLTDIADPFGPPIYGDKVRSPGFIGGGQIGFNHQVGSMVFGVEADVSGVSSDGTNTCFAFSGNSVSSNCRVRPDLYTTVTGRIGYAVDRSLFYVKGGAAWTRGTVDMFVNQNFVSPNTIGVFTSRSSFVTPGWTIGAGVEYALASAWSVKLEYDYLGFRDQDVATPYGPGNPFNSTTPTTAISQHVHQFKLGLNYRLADGVNWPGSAGAMPFRAAPINSPSGWTFEASARYVYGWGRFQRDNGTGLADGSTAPNGIVNSRLTYYDMQTNTSEVFGRINGPGNVFVKGFAGVGITGRGHQTDEDSFVRLKPGVQAPYSNSFSDKVEGHLNYAVGDVGYDFMRGSGHKIGAFVGYSFIDQALNRFNCVQIANLEQGGCTEAAGEKPTPPNVVRFQEIDKWHAVRVGIAGEMMLTDRVKLGGEVAYLPFVHFEGLDNHFRNPIAEFPARSNGGRGVQAEALVSYYLTDRLSLGIGGRYWGLWTTNGQFTTINTGLGPAPRYFRGAFEQAGVFVQTAYLFGGDDAPRTTPIYYKALSTGVRNDWSGFYAGVVGGGDWGRSKHLNNGGGNNNTLANDITSTFHVNGALLGASAGYNTQFASMWLFGVEGDMSWSNASGTASLIPPFNTPKHAGTQESWLATARVRLGVVPVDRWLAYVTGGVALADVKAQIINPDTTFTESHIRGGWTVGACAEVALDRNWSAKLEYLHVGLTDMPYFTPPPPDNANRGGGVPFNQEIVRGGLSYRFN
jgi:opacity protein-like surface antigen